MKGKKYDKGKPMVDLVLGGFPRALLGVSDVGTFGATLAVTKIMV